jgi:signal recognition particle GTPase
MEELKLEIQRQIVEAVVQHLEKNLISPDTSTEIATFVLDTLSNVSTQFELESFLTELTSRWNMFESILKSEEGKSRLKVEQEQIDGVLLLAKHGKIDEALQLAKSATN